MKEDKCNDIDSDRWWHVDKEKTIGITHKSLTHHSTLLECSSFLLFSTLPLPCPFWFKEDLTHFFSIFSVLSPLMYSVAIRKASYPSFSPRAFPSRWYPSFYLHRLFFRHHHLDASPFRSLVHHSPLFSVITILNPHFSPFTWRSLSGCIHV